MNPARAVSGAASSEKVSRYLAKILSSPLFKKLDTLGTRRINLRKWGRRSTESVETIQSLKVHAKCTGDRTMKPCRHLLSS